MMPDNINQLLWWALNGAILVVAFFIRTDLKEIKTDLRDSRKKNDDHEKRISNLEGHVGNCAGCSPGGRRAYDPPERKTA